MATVVLVIALVGSLAALQHGLTESRLGQNRQAKVMLAESALERERLIDKTAFFTDTTVTGSSTRFSAPPVFNARPGADITLVAPGTAPWVPDPTTSADPNDLSVGAYFNILPDGTITRAAVAGNPACNSAALPPGTICREMFTHQGLPFGATDLTAGTHLGPTANVATTWVRIVRKPNNVGVTLLPPEIDIIMAQVVVQ